MVCKKKKKNTKNHICTIFNSIKDYSHTGIIQKFHRLNSTVEWYRHLQPATCQTFLQQTRKLMRTQYSCLPEAMIMKLTAKDRWWQKPRCITSQNLYPFFSWKIIYWVHTGRHSGNKLARSCYSDAAERFSINTKCWGITVVKTG